MLARGGYNSPNGSGSGWVATEHHRGRGRGRGFPRGRGRGRGGAFTYTDMSSMSFEYESMSVQESSNASQGPVATAGGSAGTSHPASRSDKRAYISNASNMPSFEPVFRPVQDKQQKSSTPSPRPASPAGPSRHGFSQASKHAGLGANVTVIGGGREQATPLGDSNLLRPVTFVKSSSKIAPTIDAKEQEALKAKQAAISSQMTILSRPASVAPTSGDVDMALPATSSSMERGPSNASASSGKSSVLSPHAAEYVRPSFLGDRKPVFGSSKPATAPTLDKGKGREEPPLDDSALFFVDSIGDREAATEDDGAESDTEELWPRTRATAAAEETPTSAFPTGNQPKAEGIAASVLHSLSTTSASNVSSPAPSSAPAAHIPIKPYARVVTDNMPLEQLFRPFVPQLSASAKEFVATATATGPSGKQDKSRKVSKKQAKREAKERKKARRTDKKTERRAFKASFNEPKRPRTGDSDVEWGSDGPPAMSGDEDSDSDDEDVMDVIASSSHIKGKITSNGKRKGAKKDAAIEAALADYAANLAENDPEELEALKAFAKGMSGREHLTIGDLEDLEDITDSDEETSDDEAFEERLIVKDFVKAQGLGTKKLAVKESFPIYVPKPKSDGSGSDEEDTVDEAWKTDEAGTEDGTDMSFDAAAALEAGDSEESSASDDDEEDQDEENEVVETTIEETILIVSDGTASSEESEDEEEEERDLAEMHDDEIDDILFASSKPARRKRQGPAPSGADDIDEMLQAQWRKDREKKAIKRQERALARLEKKPSKANSKKAKRAAQKVRGFRDSDDDMMDLDVGGGKVPQFHKINQDLRDFIETTHMGEYALPAMDKKYRVAIHMLADAYNLKSKSRGVGKHRHNVLYRTQHTSVQYADHRKVNKFLSVTASWASGSTRSLGYGGPAKGKGSRKPGNANAGGGNAYVSRNYEGAAVGEGADKIASDNRGYGMLAKMGWTEGMQIGRGGGISEPIVAIVKTSKAGLGSGWVRYNRGDAGTSTPLQAEA